MRISRIGRWWFDVSSDVRAVTFALRPEGGRGLGGAACGECGDRVEGVLLAESVGLGLSPSASVVVLLMSDFLGFYC